MKILFDQGVPKPLQACLAGHEVRRAFELRGWKMVVFILGCGNWPEIKPHAARIAEEINSARRPGVYFFAIDPGST